MELSGKRVWVAGHRGMVGGAVARRLEREFCQILTVDRRDLDLCRQADVEDWVATAKPEVIVLAAAKVGGIHANSTFPADFLYDNLLIEANIIRAAHGANVEKLLFLGSSCIYPREAAQPMDEAGLLTGPLEPTNEWYAVAKIAGIKLCQAFRRQHGCDFISAMPTNLYGPGDNFHRENSHVPAALLRRFHEAKTTNVPEVVVWGSGMPLREFLYVEDLADACVHLLRTYSAEQHVNVGTGHEISIGDFARTLADIVGFKGKIVFDTSRPDGAPRKVLDVSRLAEMGWTAPTQLENGLRAYYRWFLDHINDLRQ
jgi:GDP-L-fucose synthase